MQKYKTEIESIKLNPNILKPKQLEEWQRIVAGEVKDPRYNFYSTVTEWLKNRVSSPSKYSLKKYNSLVCKFTLSFKISTLTKTSHYTTYQQKLFEEVKRLKEIEGLVMYSIKKDIEE